MFSLSANSIVGHLGLVPPNIHTTRSPFGRGSCWSPSGVYGPFERMLTYYSLYSVQKKIKQHDINVSCVGGLVNGDHVIEAILLGADTVQLSSGILWKSLKLIQQANQVLKKYMRVHEYEFLDDFRGKSLEYIADSAGEIKEYTSVEGMRNNQMSQPYILESECKLCLECINSSCFALSFDDIVGRVLFDADLCSGCGFCIHKCRFGAVKRQK